MSLTVACVLKSGGIYDATWVSRLAAGVARHLPIEYRFVCLSDVAVPCERIPLEHDWPGWWSKIELFKLQGPVLFFDLDTVIVGDLEEIAGFARTIDFMMLRDFYAADHFGSGVMSWFGTDRTRDLYKIFAKDPEANIAARRTRMGDQAYIEETFARKIWAWQDFVGDQIVSYKVHCRNGIPLNARVVCLHGPPKFADMPVNDPVRRAWELAA
jgi:hypothetical protein